MKKYVTPFTKVVSININSIMETALTPQSGTNEGDNVTARPLELF